MPIIASLNSKISQYRSTLIGNPYARMGINLLCVFLLRSISFEACFANMFLSPVVLLICWLAGLNEVCIFFVIRCFRFMARIVRDAIPTSRGLVLITAYRHLETYARDRGAGMLLIQLQPP